MLLDSCALSLITPPLQGEVALRAIEQARAEGLKILRTLNAAFLYSLFFLPLTFVAVGIVFVSLPTFCRPKSSKKAQHRQNQSLSSLLRNFSELKYPSFGVRLPSTFLWKPRECQIWPHFVCQKICPSLPCLSSAVACDFDSAVFLGNYLCCGKVQFLLV